MTRNELVQKFVGLFPGSADSHTIFVPSGEQNSAGKALGKYQTIHSAATLDDYRKHLEGEYYLTLKPGGPDGLYSWTSNDIDNLSGAGCIETLNKYGDVCVTNSAYQRAKENPDVVPERLAIYPQPSKSENGWHGYVFFEEPQLRTSIHALFRMWNSQLGHPSCEVFPKEVAPDKTEFGINLPWFGIFKDEKNLPKFELWLDSIRRQKVTPAMLDEAGRHTSQLLKSAGTSRPGQPHPLRLKPSVDLAKGLSAAGLEYQTRTDSLGTAYDYHGLGDPPQKCLIAGRVHEANSRNPRECSFIVNENNEVLHCCFHEDCKSDPDGNYTRRALKGLNLEHLLEDTRFPYSDESNAERMVKEYGENLRYCHDSHKWHIWDGTRWAVDEIAEVDRLAKRTVRSMAKEAVSMEDDDKRKKAIAWTMQSENRLEKIVSRARSQREVSITSKVFDTDPWLLNVQNGTIDLLTGRPQSHSRENLLTRICPVDYQPESPCPKFEEFLREIFFDQPETIGFIQRAVGYTLTGDTSEQCFFILIGTGKNGKGVLLRILANLLGDYGKPANFDMLMVKKFGQSGPRDGKAKLMGARFVRASESEDGQRMAESVIKEMIGGDGAVSASRLYQEEFEYTPQFKLWLATNHEPQIRGTDDGIWRRIHRVNFNYTVPTEKQNPYLADHLWKEESSGILNWALAGLRLWQKGGLKPPKAVRQASEDYRNTQNIVRRFFDECIAEGSSDESMPASAVYKVFKRWCLDNYNFVLSQPKFGAEFSKLATRKHTEHGSEYFGIHIVGELSLEPTSQSS
jgi:P4 family phage/plasmid primase-like protien